MNIVIKSHEFEVYETTYSNNKYDYSSIKIFTTPNFEVRSPMGMVGADAGTKNH